MNLVREYVSCMDEMSQIYDISRQKIEFLRKLHDFYKDFGELYWRTLNEQINWAIMKIENDNKNLPLLVNDLKASLDVVIISSPYIQIVS